MNYYLIDYENVRNDGLKDLTKLSSDDCINIFYSEQCKNISLDVISNIRSKNAILNCYKVKIGTKNALDFQLASHLGYLIGKSNPNDRFYIVSNDKGFECLCDYWKELNISVCRCMFITETQEKSNSPTTKKRKVRFLTMI